MASVARIDEHKSKGRFYSMRQRIWKCEAVKGNTKFVLFAMIEDCTEGQSMFKSEDKLADMTGLSIWTIKRAVAELLDLQLIERDGTTASGKPSYRLHSSLRTHTPVARADDEQIAPSPEQIAPDDRANCSSSRANCSAYKEEKALKRQKAKVSTYDADVVDIVNTFSAVFEQTTGRPYHPPRQKEYRAAAELKTQHSVQTITRAIQCWQSKADAFAQGEKGHDSPLCLFVSQFGKYHVHEVEYPDLNEQLRRQREHQAAQDARWQELLDGADLTLDDRNRFGFSQENLDQCRAWRAARRTA